MSNPTLYALAKQVPAMLGGFSIGTSYGDIDISDADECRAVAAVVRALLEQRLQRPTDGHHGGCDHADS